MGKRLKEKYSRKAEVSKYTSKQATKAEKVYEELEVEQMPLQNNKFEEQKVNSVPNVNLEESNLTYLENLDITSDVTKTTKNDITVQEKVEVKSKKESEKHTSKPKSSVSKPAVNVAKPKQQVETEKTGLFGNLFRKFKLSPKSEPVSYVMSEESLAKFEATLKQINERKSKSLIEPENTRDMKLEFLEEKYNEKISQIAKVADTIRRSQGDSKEARELLAKIKLKLEDRKSSWTKTYKRLVKDGEKYISQINKINSKKANNIHEEYRLSVQNINKRYKIKELEAKRSIIFDQFLKEKQSLLENINSQAKEPSEIYNEQKAKLASLVNEFSIKESQIQKDGDKEYNLTIKQRKEELEKTPVYDENGDKVTLDTPRVYLDANQLADFKAILENSKLDENGGLSLSPDTIKKLEISTEKQRIKKANLEDTLTKLSAARLDYEAKKEVVVAKMDEYAQILASLNDQKEEIESQYDEKVELVINDIEKEAAKASVKLSKNSVSMDEFEFENDIKYSDSSVKEKSDMIFATEKQKSNNTVFSKAFDKVKNYIEESKKKSKAKKSKKMEAKMDLVLTNIGTSTDFRTSMKSMVNEPLAKKSFAEKINNSRNEMVK